MAIATNPILKGFNPDPSIIRVGNDYYIATSTFEWFPGVQIHHSTDLVHWELIARPLNRKSQLDMLGVPDSCGVWAPCLSYGNGTFYLVYSNVKTFDGVWKDTPNYVVTTDDIRGDWSDPVFISSAGFDGSLFHDSDGRKWYSSLLVDHRNGLFFGGIQLQEFDENKGKLIGATHHIFNGSALGVTEGPHIYKKDGYYYLITAEGGTEYGHAVSICRSKEITGPYELHPNNPLVSSRNDPSAYLQKTGHGDLVEAQDGNWYTVFLVGRPLTQHGRCTLGRETAIQKIEWKNDWPYLSNGTCVPDQQVEVPDLTPTPYTSEEVLDHFDSKELNKHFQALRIPITNDWLTLCERPGYLRLYGRESLSSFHNQSLIARRIQAFHSTAATAIDFDPESFQQMAGLVYYYNTYHFHYLYITSADGGLTKCLNIITCDKYKFSEPLEKTISIPNNTIVQLKAHFNKEKIQFCYRTDGNEWVAIGPVLDGSILSDDYVRDEHNRYRPAFTGAFVGLCCQDLSGGQKPADFDWFQYKEID